MTHVVIINGINGAGKDTFVECVKVYCKNNECANVENISSVQPIKDMFTSLGWNGEKTEDVRNAMAVMKQIWMKNKVNNPILFLFNNIYEYNKMHYDEDNIIFCHIREMFEIVKLKNILCGFDGVGIDCSTLLVTRDYAHSSCDRSSDNKDNVHGYSYDTVIANNGTVTQLAEKAKSFVDNLLEKEI